MAEYSVSAHIDLGGLIGGLQRSIQRSIDLVSFGLRAAETATEEQLTIPEAFFQLTAASNEVLNFDTARREFRIWALSGGLRDCVEAVAAFLEEARTICALWSFVSQSRIKGSDWKERVVLEGKKFHRLGLPNKIEFLKTRYDSSLAPELTEEILSINRSRNCLVHRRGIVSQVDLNSPEGLLVQWVKVELMAGTSEGEKRVVMPPASTSVAAGEVISMRRVKTSKLFQPGHQILFGAQEFIELCLTFFLFGSQLRTNLEKHGRAKGVQFKDSEGTPAKNPE